jgi:homoserine dehydrogenase
MTEPLRIGIAGLGTVGASVFGILADRGAEFADRLGRSMAVTGVCARDRSRDRGIDLSGAVWFDDPVALARSGDIDVFVELMGGEDGQAKLSVEAALRAGRHVVTANKALLANHGTALARLAEDNGVALNFEAAVAGVIPIVKTMRECLGANRIHHVYGIMNGTCNYILTEMEREKREFAAVLSDAQELGYAEADPTFDVGGFDTAHKLAILTSLAFGTEVSFEDVYIEGIEKITQQDLNAAAELGFRIKLLGVALDTGNGIEQRVHPTMVPIDSPIADVDGVFNAVAISGDHMGDLMLEGRGAGAGPTASAVIADLFDVAAGHIVPAFGRPASKLAAYRQARMRAHEGGYYVALELYDRPGAVAAIAKRMAEQGISLESIIQKPRTLPHRQERVEKSGTMPVVLITHDTLEQAVREALDAIEVDGHISSSPRMIRIEKLQAGIGK